VWKGVSVGEISVDENVELGKTGIAAREWCHHGIIRIYSCDGKMVLGRATGLAGVFSSSVFFGFDQ
jgi:hypothetical protein